MSIRWSEEDLARYQAKSRKPIPAPKVVHKLGRGKHQAIDGYKFVSGAEARRYEELKLMQAAGEIFDLQVHPWWPIVVNGVEICRVAADFAYYQYVKRKGQRMPRFLPAGTRLALAVRKVVEDVKRERIGKDGKVKFSTDTRISQIGRKLLLAMHGIEVEVVK